MAGRRKFRAQPLQVVCTEEMRETLDRIAEGEDISLAQVVREALEGDGLAARLALHEKRMLTKSAAT